MSVRGDGLCQVRGGFIDQFSIKRVPLGFIAQSGSGLTGGRRWTGSVAVIWLWVTVPIMSLHGACLPLPWLLPQLDDLGHCASCRQQLAGVQVLELVGIGIPE